MDTERRNHNARTGGLGGSFGLPGWSASELVGAVMALGLLLILNDRIDLIWTPVPWWIAALALVAVTLLIRRVPPVVAALWLLGLLSYVWSLAPGNTLLAALWGLVWVASATGGRWGAGATLAIVLIVSNDLQSAIALNAFHLQSYVSGSVHYRLGAKALVLLPLALAGLGRGQPRWLTLPWWVLATASAYSALISGSRGVYLPLVVLVAAVVFRARRERRVLRRTLVGIAMMMVAIVAIDGLIPSHPAMSALGSKASVESQASAVAVSGSFTQRLRFWDQGLAMVVHYPLGVGEGAFRSTIHAFQRFPMVWSSSPHNVFVETLATLGWPGLALLVGMLAASFVAAWRSSRWPWALSLLGIWLTLSVDVTADYPSMVAIAFVTVGACLGPGDHLGAAAEAERPAKRFRTLQRSLLGGLVIVAGLALSPWWFAPCSGPRCALTRWRGVEYRAVASAAAIPQGQRATYFRRLERLYPRSLWVLELEEHYADSLEARLTLARRIALSYPLQSWRNYLTWANLSLQAGDVAQAKEAVRAGRKVFGPDSKRFPERRADPAGFEAWLARGEAILALPE